MNDFYTMLSHDASRACYGPKHVKSANEVRAIQTLLIMDELFRNTDFKMRQKYVDLVESVKASGGVVHIFSSMHPSGRQLGQITGVAPILRFPLYELDDLEIVI